MATGGASSVFLAVLLVLLSHAGAEVVARIVAAWAQLCGAVRLLAAVDFPRRHPRPVEVP